MRPLSVVAVALWPTWAAATCPPAEPEPPGSFAVAAPTALIVTHATGVHDPRLATKPGIDAAVALARREGLPVIYLQDDSPPDSYFAGDCAPERRIRSEGGELGFGVPDDAVVSVGGHLEMCLSVSWHEVLLQWSKRPPRSRTLTVFMDGVYSNAKAIDEQDPYYDALSRFMNVVTYGRPGGEHWPKLTLLETLGIIIEPAAQIDYLVRVLPNWARTMPPAYRVELWLNGALARRLQGGEGRMAPVLRFDFRDSALDPALSLRQPNP
ncbi:MAG: hypothetical protein KDH20_07895 [Rhodocyclaceae bacterium]|nr:hypothetical protein [Rhodocyclaceae bacterium]